MKWTWLYLFALAPLAFAGTGTIVGEVPLPQEVLRKRIAVEKYTGKISGKVARPPAPIAGVWLTQKKLKASSPSKNQILHQKDYQFGKSLMVIPRGTTVSFPNEDADHHNIFSLSRAKRFDLGRYKKNEKPVPVVTFQKAGLVELRCEIHEHMQAKILVVDSPYYSVTNEKGQFKLSGIPAGVYTLNALFDKKRKWTTTVTVIGNKTTKIQLSALK